MSSGVTGPIGKRPHEYRVMSKEMELKSPISEAVLEKFKDIEGQIKSIKAALTPMGLPPDKTALPFVVFDNLMVIRDKLILDRKNLNQIEFGSLCARVDQFVLETLGLFPLNLPNSPELTNEMKSSLFTKLYDMANVLGRDAVGKESLITDIVGQEIKTPLSEVLAKELKANGWSDAQVKEGVKYASYIQPFVVLSLYMHPQSPIPKGQLSREAANDARLYMKEYDSHYRAAHKDNLVLWEQNLDLWRQVLPGGIEMIWRLRS